MRIAVLADLHIGASKRVSSFRHSEATFVEFIDRLCVDHDRLVLLGDLFQAEHGWSLGRATSLRQLELCRNRVAHLWARLEQADPLYIHGNHDAIAREALGACESATLEADGFSILFIHGHQFDPLFERIYAVTQLTTWISGRVRHLDWGGLAEWLEYKDAAIKYDRFRGPDGPYARAARRLLREHSVNAVVLGHTHFPEQLVLPEGLMVNPGSCAKELCYASIDTEARTVRLCRG